MRTRITGIYKITNQTNDKVYVGKSVDVLTRWKQHQDSLMKQQHFNQHLQNSWNNHGEESFKFEVLEKCEREQLKYREIFWMKYYKSLNAKYGYNIVDEEKSKKYTYESNLVKGVNRVYQLDKDDNVISIFDSIHSAAKVLGISSKTMYKCIFGMSNGKTKRRSYKNYVWILEKDYDRNKIYYREKRAKKYPKQRSLKYNPHLIINYKGEVIEKFDFIEQVCSYFNLTKSQIYNIIKGQKIIKQNKIIKESIFSNTIDYTFSLENPKELPILYKIKNTITEEIVEIFSIAQTAKQLNISNVKLGALLKGVVNKGGRIAKMNKYKEWIKIPL